jgi:hypothetical protein
MNKQINFQCKSVLQQLAILCATMFFTCASYAQEQVKVVVIPMAGDDLRTVYEIGKTGPAGGVVFHVTDGGLHGLEASHEDQSEGVQWGCSGTSITNIDDVPNNAEMTPDSNTGAHNTLQIVAQCEAGSMILTAAKVTNSYTGPNGKTTGWYLPNKQELNLLYNQRVVVGGFADVSYWSSSQLNSNFAWGQRFGDSNPIGGIKGDPVYRVRAVRAF